MTEPGVGSDLAAVATTAVRDGDHWVINGQKTFISNGMECDLVVVVARTAVDDDEKPDQATGARGLSLFVVEGGAAGFVKSRQLEKMGQHGQDTDAPLQHGSPPAFSGRTERARKPRVRPTGPLKPRQPGAGR